MTRSATPVEPVDSLITQGNVLEDSGDFEAALHCYRKALALAPGYARAHMNIGNALQRLGRLDEAVVAQREACVLSPDHAPAHFNLASVLVASGDLAAAESTLREALRLETDMAEASVLLADVLESTGRVADAEAELQRALRNRPGFAGAALNLGRLYMHSQRIDDAERILLQARAMDPSLAAIEATLGSLYLRTGRVSNACRAYRQAMDSGVQGAESSLLFSLNLSTEFDPAMVFREHARIGEAMVRAAEAQFTCWPNRPEPGRKLKIGYVSGDFYKHPIGLFSRPVLERHDRACYEVHCYSNRTAVDDVTRVLQQLVEHWHIIANKAAAVVADQVRLDAIDILVDLSGHTYDNRLDVFAMRPAPIQASWLGYLNTTGLPTMDYRICDWNTDPEGETDQLHTERLHRLPHSQWCYAPYYDVPLVAQGQRGAGIIFGSFNQYMKISDDCLDLWCQILARVPEARLVVLSVPGGNTQTLFRQRLAARNINPDRVEIRDRIGIFEYFAAIASVDIALETFPYNGATTALDTLWMGVPMIALRGERGIARGGYSILRSIGLPELIARDPAEYVELNVRLARDRSSRERLRATLRSRLATSPLMDSAAFVANLESAYRQMWRVWCTSKRQIREGI